MEIVATLLPESSVLESCFEYGTRMVRLTVRLRTCKDFIVAGYLVNAIYLFKIKMLIPTQNMPTISVR